MKLHVGVFFGGKATEHEVSVISALQAIENMDKLNINMKSYLFIYLKMKSFIHLLSCLILISIKILMDC